MICRTKKIKFLSALLAIAMMVTHLPITAFAVGEPPTLQSAVVTADGHVEMIFDKAMAAPESGAAGFTVVGSEGANKHVIAAQLVDGDNTKIRLILTTTIKGGEAPWLRYTPGTVASADGGLLGEITIFDITNNLMHPTLDTMAPLDGVAGTSYTHTFTATGGTEGYTFSCDFGTLPLGLNLNSSTGVLSGTPSIAGVFSFRIKVRDANDAFDKQEFIVRINSPAANVCELSDGRKFTTLGEALDEVEDGQTITLLQNIPSASGIMVSGKSIELNLNGKTLSISTSGQNGIEVQSGGVLTIGGGGQLDVNVTGAASHGLYASGTLTIASPCTVISANGIGVYAYSGDIILQNASVTGHGIGAQANYGSVEITGDVAATGGPGSHGVSAYSGGQVEITGSVSAGSIGIFVDGADSQIIVKGDVTVNEAGSLGVYVYDSGKAKIDGVIMAATYIQVGTTTKTAADSDASSTIAGYLQYSSDDSTFIWVRDTGGVCRIVETGIGYETFEGALIAALNAGSGTIQLLQDVTVTAPIIIEEADITFDLNNHDLTVDTSAAENSTALSVNSSSVNCMGNGSFTVIGAEYGIYAIAGSVVTVTGDVSVAALYGVGVFAGGNSQVTVDGDVSATGENGTGVQASEGRITVTGTVTASGAGGMGIESYNSGSLITAENGVTADACAVTAYYNGVAIVLGAVAATGTGGVGVEAYGLGEVTVTGSITAPAYGTGVWVKWDTGREIGPGTVTVMGDVTVGSGQSDGNGTGIYANGGEVTVNGSVTAIVYGLDISAGIVHVTGNVTSETFYGVRVNSAAEVTVDGEIIAPSYMDVSGSDRPKDSKNSIDDNGYWIYNGYDGSVVKVGNCTNNLPTVTTYQVLGDEVTSTGAQLRGSVTSEGSSPVITYGFAYGTGTNPTMSDGAIAGVGTAANFTAVLTDLTPGTTYHVRAYAINSAGTAYGTDRSFTTPTADPPGIPANRGYLAHDGAMELLWEAPDDGGSPILYYEILMGGDLTAPWTNVGNITSHMATGLDNGLYYVFHVRAVNAAGTGEAGMINGYPNIPTVPGPPRELSTHASSHQVQVRWREPWSNGYRAITGYEVSLDNSHWIASDYNSSHTFTGLTNGITYTFYVRAVNAVGAGEAAHIQGAPRSSGGGYAGGGSTPPVTPPSLPKAEVLDSEGNTSSTVTAILNSSTDTATVEVDSAALNGAFNISKTNDNGVMSIEVVIPEISGAKAYEVTLPADTFNAGDSSKTVEIKTELANVTLPGNMLPGDIVFEVEKLTLAVAIGDKSVLDPAMQAQMGDRPILELSLILDDQQIAWSNENAPVTVTIPYTPTEAELANPESIIIWYIDGAGNAISVPNGRYDPVTGSVTFTTTHFSYYAVGYNKVSFKDVPKSVWYNKAVSFIAARGITTGTGNGSYSPDAKLTRGDFLVLLMKAYGISPDANPKDNFTDAGNTYYTGYLAAAKRLGISTGVGNNIFEPEKEITRQEMFTLLYNALKIIDKLPQGNSGKSLLSFSDTDDIAPWAKDAMRMLVETETISGSGNRLSPKDTTNRAQMAQVLYSLLSK